MNAGLVTITEVIHHGDFYSVLVCTGTPAAAARDIVAGSPYVTTPRGKVVAESSLTTYGENVARTGREAVYELGWSTFTIAPADK